MNGPDFSFAEDRMASRVAAINLRPPDWSGAENEMQQAAYWAGVWMCRPAVIFHPVLSIDGNQWCALYGADLQSGVAGFGASPDLAMADFDANWLKELA